MSARGRQLAGARGSEETMSRHEIIRAWKDAEYLASLSEARRAALPAHPAGPVELGEIDLAEAAGGTMGTPTPRCYATQPVLCQKSNVLSSCHCFQWG
jgi:mersacidin/lichenicidin family type 2 lantibiotic